MTGEDHGGSPEVNIPERGERLPRLMTAVNGIDPARQSRSLFAIGRSDRVIARNCETLAKHATNPHDRR